MKEKNYSKEIMLYDIIDFWYNNYVKAKKPSTIESYRINISRTKKYCTNIPYYLFKDADAEKLLQHLANDGYSKSTIKKSLTVLKQSYLVAYRNNIIPKCTYFKVPIPTNAKVHKVPALTIEEQKQVEKCCENMDYGYITLFLLETGIRINELCNLKWEDYNTKPLPNIVIRKSKTENGIRIVPLTAKANNIIINKPKISKYIFISKSGKKFTKSMLKEHNKEIREQTGIKEFHNHICRHTFATRAIERNMNIKALSVILGHSSVAFTLQRYADAKHDWLFEQMKIMNN